MLNRTQLNKNQKQILYKRVGLRVHGQRPRPSLHDVYDVACRPMLWWVDNRNHQKLSPIGISYWLIYKNLNSSLLRNRNFQSHSYSHTEYIITTQHSLININRYDRTRECTVPNIDIIEIDIYVYGTKRRQKSSGRCPNSEINVAIWALRGSQLCRIVYLFKFMYGTHNSNIILYFI